MTETVINTQSTVYVPQRLKHRKLLLGALVVIFLGFVISRIFGFPIILSFLLAAQVTLFFMLFSRPVWAMSALIMGQLTVNNFLLPIGGGALSLRLFWTVLAIIFLIPVLRKRGGLRLGGRSRRIIIPAVILFICAAMSNLINADISYVMQYLRMNAAALVFIIFIPAVVENEKDLKRLGIVVLITCFISALFAILQYRGGFFGIPPYSAYGIYEPQYSLVRVVGLSESPVQLGFNLPMILLPMVGVYFLHGVSLRTRKLMILLAAVITIGLYFTFTRSGLYSMVPGFIFLLLFMRGKARRNVFLLLLVIAVAAVVLLTSSNNRYAQSFGEDSSSTGRLVLWQAGTQVALDNPIFGIGWVRFREASIQYATMVNAELLKHESGAGAALGRYEAHNDFIHVWAAFGTLALIAFIWILVGSFSNFLFAYRHSKRKFLKGFAIGCFGGVAAYIVNSFTHNVMDTSMLLWIVCGLSIAVAKVSMKKIPTKETRVS